MLQTFILVTVTRHPPPVAYIPPAHIASPIRTQNRNIGIRRSLQRLLCHAKTTVSSSEKPWKISPGAMTPQANGSISSIEDRVYPNYHQLLDAVKQRIDPKKYGQQLLLPSSGKPVRMKMSPEEFQRLVDESGGPESDRRYVVAAIYLFP